MMRVIRLVMCFVKEMQKIVGTSFKSIAIKEALTKHLNSPGYRFMMSQIQGSLQGVTTKVLDGDILVNHGGQSFVRP